MALTDNLIACWELESGALTTDAHSTNTLTNVNTVTSAAGGKVGGAGQFVRASSQRLSIADNAALSTGDVDFLIAAWIFMDSKASGFNANTIASKYGASGQNVDHEWNLQYAGATTDRFRFTVRPGVGTIGTVDADNFGAPSLSTWYYVLGWHDSVNDTINIQVNNGTVNSQAYSLGTINGTAAFEIGDASGGLVAPFDGRIDQVLFYKGGFPNSTDRTSLYNGGSGLSYAAMSSGGGSTPSPAQGALTLAGQGTSLGFTINMPDEA